MLECINNNTETPVPLQEVCLLVRNECSTYDPDYPDFIVPSLTLLITPIFTVLKVGSVTAATADFQLKTSILNACHFFSQKQSMHRKAGIPHLQCDMTNLVATTTYLVQTPVKMEPGV